MSDDAARRGVERDLLADMKPGQIHDRHRPAALIGHKAVAVKAASLTAATRKSGRGG